MRRRDERREILAAELLPHVETETHEAVPGAAGQKPAQARRELLKVPAVLNDQMHRSRV